MMRHIEYHGIVRTVYSGIFRHIKGDSAIWSHIQTYLGTLRQFRHIQALLRHIEPYSDLFRTLCNPCYNRATYRTLTYLEPYQTCKMIRHFSSHGIFRIVYSRIFKDIQEYSGIFRIHIQPHFGHYSFFKTPETYLKCLTAF